MDSSGDIWKIIYLGFEKSQRSVTHDILRYINILTYLLIRMSCLSYKHDVHCPPVKRTVAWNRLPTAIHNMDLSLNTFRRELEMVYLCGAYVHDQAHSWRPSTIRVHWHQIFELNKTVMLNCDHTHTAPEYPCEMFTSVTDDPRCRSAVRGSPSDSFE